MARLKDTAAGVAPFDLLLVDETMSVLWGPSPEDGREPPLDLISPHVPRVVLTRRGPLAWSLPERPLTIALSRPIRQRQLFAALARAVGRARVAEPRRIVASTSVRTAPSSSVPSTL